MPRKSRVSQVDWDKYKSIISDFIDEDAGKQPFFWLKKSNLMSPFGEDATLRYTIHSLEGLFHYNYVKTWPNNRVSITGELDTGNMVLYISVRTLKEAGFLDIYGYWDFNWAEDRFIINGKVYRPGGDTQVAQANNEPLLFFIILQREDEKEAEDLLKTVSKYINPSSDSNLKSKNGSLLLTSDGRVLTMAEDTLIRGKGDQILLSSTGEILLIPDKSLVIL